MVGYADINEKELEGQYLEAFAQEGREKARQGE